MAQRWRMGLVLVSLVGLVAGCGGPAGTPRPTPPPSGSTDAMRQHYAQNANRLTACDAVVSIERARSLAQDEVAAFEAKRPTADYPAAIASSQGAARAAWGPLGYPDDPVGDAIDAADAAVTTFANAAGEYEAGGGRAATVTPAEGKLTAAFDALHATLSELGLACA